MNRNITRIVAIAATLAMGNIAGGLRRQQRRFQQGPRVFHEQQGRGRGPVQGTGQHVHQEDRRAGGHPDRSRRHV